MCGGWVELLRGLQELGPLTLQSESNGSVIEAQGIAVAGSWSGRRGALRIGASRLRLQLDRWFYGYAIKGEDDAASVQFFAADGQRILTINRTPEAMRERWTQLVRRFTSADQNPWVELVPTPEPSTADRPDSGVDLKALRAAWDDPQQRHDCGDLSRQFGVARLQAFRLAGESRARVVPTSTFKTALRCAASAHVPVALTVESIGLAHTYTGIVRRVEHVESLLTVVEPGMRLYISEPRVAAAWLVRRPTAQGTLSSLQYFDPIAQPILTVAGNTTPGEPGLDRWERLVASL